MQFCVVDTFNKPHEYFGTIHSCHKTLSAARKSNDKLQRQVRDRNGSSSYIPTVIIQVDDGFRHRPGDQMIANYTLDDLGRWWRDDSRPLAKYVTVLSWEEVR